MADKAEKKSVQRKDGWMNLFSGMGTKADKTKATMAVPTGFLSDAEKEIVYADDGLGARIVDLLPEDMMKQGWHYVFEDEKEGMDNYSKVYNHIFKDIRANYKIAQALKWARLYGGALLLLGVPQRQSQLGHVASMSPALHGANIRYPLTRLRTLTGQIRATYGTHTGHIRDDTD